MSAPRTESPRTTFADVEPAGGVSLVAGARRMLGTALAITGLTVLAVLALEGVASLAMLVHDVAVARAPRDNERPHTVHDTLLGWVNRAGSANPDEYGQGIALTTDPQGFRGTRTLTALAPAGVVRIVCSGDSFTIGYGVDDAHAWCHRLEAELPGVETMNLGQAAYGLDQAYLWYLRDGVKYQHHVQLLALTGVQFERSMSTSFLGRFKPQLALDGQRLATVGVPVPPQSDGALRRANATRLLDDLRFMQWLRLWPRFDGGQQAAREVDARWPLFEAVFASLAEHHQRRGSELVIVYLPAANDLRSKMLERRRAAIAASATRLGLPFVDLTPALKAMRPDSQDLAFIAKAPPGAAPAVAGHYSNLGNRWVAHELGLRLPALPRVGTLLGTRAASSRRGGG